MDRFSDWYNKTNEKQKNAIWWNYMKLETNINGIIKYFMNYKEMTSNWMKFEEHVLTIKEALVPLALPGPKLSHMLCANYANITPWTHQQTFATGLSVFIYMPICMPADIFSLDSHAYLYEFEWNYMKR